MALDHANRGPPLPACAVWEASFGGGDRRAKCAASPLARTALSRFGPRERDASSHLSGDRVAHQHLVVTFAATIVLSAISRSVVA